jgi:HEAT repeat protein
MMWVCPLCWEIFSLHETRCPKCGADLAAADQRSFTEKLERSLDHPEPQTAMRAADILARRLDDSGHTISVLTAALGRRWHEPYVAAAIVRAIGRLEGRNAHDALMNALNHDSVIVRAAAAECLQGRAKAAS